MDRIDPTPVDEALAQLLTEPTYGAQILIATAATLQAEDPFLALTDQDLTAVLGSVSECLVGHLPPVVADEAYGRATAALPAIGYRERHADYAVRLLPVAGRL